MNNLLVLVMLFFSVTLFSQENGTVKGTITDLELQGEPLFFATVSLKDTHWKTETNFHGNFEIEGIEPGSYTLVVSYLGYENLEVPIQIRGTQETNIQQGLHAHRISMDDINPYNDLSEKDTKMNPGPVNPSSR